MRRLLTLLLLLPLFASAQYVPIGNQFQRQVSGADTIVRVNTGATGYFYPASRYFLQQNYSPIPNGLQSGGVVTVSGTTANVTSANYRINKVNYSSPVTNITGITPATTSMFRYDVIYANTSNQVLKITGIESDKPIEPSIPANTIKLASILVSDNGAGDVTPDLSGYLPLTGGVVDGPLVARGGAGPLLVTGMGGRMLWHPAKSAFRAGYVSGTEWNESNIGLYSAAFGYSPISSGTGGFSTGNKTVASGAYSAAMGSYVSTAGFAGAFILGDFSTNTVVHSSTAIDQFTARFNGGYRFFTDAAVSKGITFNNNGIAKYLGDYSANYDARSLVDKAYVDGKTGAIINGTGFVKANGTTLSYDNSTYVTTNTNQDITGSKTFRSSALFYPTTGAAPYTSLSNTALNLITATGAQNRLTSESIRIQDNLGSTFFNADQYAVSIRTPNNQSGISPIGPYINNPSISGVSQGGITIRARRQTNAPNDDNVAWLQNKTYTLADSADVANIANTFVDKTTAQTITGNKTFTGTSTFGEGNTKVQVFPGSIAVFESPSSYTAYFAKSISRDYGVTGKTALLEFPDVANVPANTELKYTLPSSTGTIALTSDIPTLPTNYVTTNTDQAITGKKTFSSNDGMLATGTYGSGATQNLGAGNRMQWYPKKAAFRSGTVDGTQWNDANMGDYSAAFGSNTIASDNSTFAAGQGSVASGTVSTAIGLNSKASGPYSIAIGNTAVASANGSTAIGNNVTASGSSSFALGNGVGTATMTGSFIIGDNNSSTIVNSTAANQFTSRFANGYRFLNNSTDGLTIGSNSVAKYLNDYSANYDSRSLIDKGYADATYSTIPDGLLNGGSIAVSGTSATASAGTYRINKISYSAPTQTFTGINPAATSMFRYEVIYATTSSNYGKVSGVESASPVEPAIPANTIKVGSILVSDAGSGDVTPDLSGYVDRTTAQTIGGAKTFTTAAKYNADYSSTYDARTLIDKGTADATYLLTKLTVTANTTLTAAQLPIKRNILVQNTGTSTITLTLPSTYAFTTLAFGNSATTVNIPAGGNVYLFANTITTVDIIGTNYVGNIVRKLARVMLIQTTAQAVGQNTNIQFNSIENSQLPDGVTTPMWSSAANTDVIIRSAGLYSITGSVRVNDAASGERSATITVNGSFKIANGSSATSPAVVATANPSTVVYLNVGDIVRLLWYSNTNVNTDPGLSTVRLNVVQMSGEYLTSGTYVTTTYGFSKLASTQTISSNGVIAISGALSPNNTIDMTGNKVTLKAGRTYKIMGDVALDGNSSAGAFLFIYWRKVGTTAEIGKTALRLASSFNGNFSENGSAMAIVKVGATDEQYELYGEVGGTASVPVRTSGFEVQEIVPTPVATEPLILPYSSIEKATGRTWTDGRIVYEKTFNLTSTSTPVASTFLNTNGTTIAHGITGLDEVIGTKATIREGANFFPIPYVGGTNVRISFNATNITSVSTSTGTSWATGANTRVNITVEYVKTP